MKVTCLLLSFNLSKLHAAPVLNHLPLDMEISSLSSVSEFFICPRSGTRFATPALFQSDIQIRPPVSTGNI